MKKTILITGGTGFLGKRLGLALKSQYNIILAGRNHKQLVYAQEVTGCEVVPMDVVNIESVRDIFNEFNPSIVIHAAATKFVDFSEKYPMECIDVNAIGSQNVARVTLENKVDAVIGISTDKASPPVKNTYGLTKALMERLFCSMNGRSSTKFCCVRYGNVAWSTGSVLTIWKKMHEERGVIGTTGPKMRRFFFTIKEAVDLVITALNKIDEIQGKVFSRKMKSAKIEDMLNLWIRKNGGRWEKIAGRPGERDDEYLVGDLELPYAYEKQLGGVTHYIISFNKKVEKPLGNCISSENVERLSEPEMLGIINNPPLEEK